MAENKKSFVLYCDLIHQIDHLTNDEKGVLFQHLLEYVNDMNPLLEDRVLLGVWKPLQMQLKRDLKKYETYIEKQKANGKKGGRPKSNKTQKTQPFLKKPKKADTVTVNDTVNVDTKVSLYSEKDFLENWATLRKKFLNKPTNIEKLNHLERADFNKSVSELGKEKINLALKGLFKQEVINFGSMTLRPKHFLENVLKYHDAEVSKEYQLYGAKKKEIQY